MTRGGAHDALEKMIRDNRSSLQVQSAAVVMIALELHELVEQLKYFNDNCVTETSVIEVSGGPDIHILGGLRTYRVRD